MTPARRNLYALAANLGVLVADIEARMTLREFIEWIQFYNEDTTLAEPTPENVLKALGG
jgi:hypothetical protein